MITLSHDQEFNLHPGQIVASLNKALYGGCLYLVALKKQQICNARFQMSIKKLGNSQLLSEWGFVQRIAPPLHSFH